jgi:hypothetical protein
LSTSDRSVLETMSKEGTGANLLTVFGVGFFGVAQENPPAFAHGRRRAKIMEDMLGKSDGTQPKAVSDAVTRCFYARLIKVCKCGTTPIAFRP